MPETKTENFHANALREHFEEDINDELSLRVAHGSRLGILQSWYSVICRGIAQDGTIDDLKAVTAEYDRLR